MAELNHQITIANLATELIGSMRDSSLPEKVLFFPSFCLSNKPTELGSMVATETTNCSLCLTHLFCVDFLLSQFSFQQTVQKLCLFLLCALMYLKINSPFASAHAQPLCCITKSQSVCVRVQSKNLIMFMLFADFSVKPKTTDRSPS